MTPKNETIDHMKIYYHYPTANITLIKIQRNHPMHRWVIMRFLFNLFYEYFIIIIIFDIF